MKFPASHLFGIEVGLHYVMAENLVHKADLLQKETALHVTRHRGGRVPDEEGVFPQDFFKAIRQALQVLLICHTGPRPIPGGRSYS